MAAEQITLAAEDGHTLTAWLAEPQGDAKGGVVVLHAVYGATPHMGDVCAKWAQAGYRAVAPALFDRLEQGLVFPYSAPAEGGKRYAALSEDQIFADIRAAAAKANPDGPAVISGFCSGGTWAWRAAAREDMTFAAHATFYGSHIAQHIELTPRCPTILHYGTADHVVPLATVEEIAVRHPEAEVHVYPGAGHAFFNPAQETYNAEAAALAWERTVGFLEQTLD
jgi:carboxymethylenebutenolidase